MASTINASNTTGGIIATGDGSGILELQSGGTTALTANGANVTVAGTFSATGGVNVSSLTGTLPIANGGTNTTATPTAGGIPYGTGTALAYTSAGTSGQLLSSSGSGAPTWIDFSSVSIDGPAAGSSMSPNTAYTFTITNYDTYTTYTLSTTNGTVTRSGATITYTPVNLGSTAGSFVINGRTIGTFNVAVPAGQQAYTTAGTYSWVCPGGVTSVSVVAVGAGGQGGWYQQGAGGGGLGYKNNIAVTPGTSYTVVVGDITSSNGQDSYFINTSTVRGGGGVTGQGQGGAGGTYTGDGGGNGGTGGNPSCCVNNGGGGGAGGYSGNGGQGGNYGSGAAAGSGGGGGGGNSGPGGGVGILGQGANGTAGGGAGSGGSGVLYGGGGSQYANNQGRGAVRIIWAGTTGITRAFPSTNTGNL